MKLHYADPVPFTARRALGLPTHGFCGEAIHRTEHNWTSAKPDVTCIKCINAMLSMALRDVDELQAQAMRLYEHEIELAKR